MSEKGEMRKAVIDFLQEKGANVSTLSDESRLMEHIQSADFMELIIVMEMHRGSELDLESADIEQISSLGGFVRWLEQVSAIED